MVTLLLRSYSPRRHRVPPAPPSLPRVAPGAHAARAGRGAGAEGATGAGRDVAACTGAGFAAGSVRAVAFLSASEPVQFATTSPVTSAVTPTSAMPIAVSFQGFQLCSAMSFSFSRVDYLPRP